MILMTSWWDTTDAISSGIIGEYLRKQSQDRIRTYAEHLMKSDNMWLQRTALIFQRKYKDQTDKELLFSLCERLSESKEFFIRKGMGWALREYAYREPELVRDFVLSHSVSPLTRREALKDI
ncbi:MAG: DNA alkylation repair protein [Ignavibacteria bacterium]|nr:DNA alkylation repair protein [Ignavibacteria bacterium]